MTPKREKSKPQARRFIEAAREAGCSEDEAVFDRNLAKIAKAAPPPKPVKKRPEKG